MRRRTRTFVALLGTVMVAMSVAAASAGASYHLIKIRSIFRGPSPTGAFIELQMYADGQNLVAGHSLQVCPPAASICSSFVLPSNVANGGNQRRILLGDTAAPGSPDFTVAGLGTSLTSVASGGAACWDTVDCVSWGAFTGEANLPTPSGTPIAGGLSGTQVSVRSIARGCATALDEPDDTNNSSADFGLAVGYGMRNNSLAPIETVCPPGNPTSPTNPAGNLRKRKCKKSNRSASVAKKKKCKKKKKKH
jgi:hypothetical protein